jgi:hypothetical protein
VVSAEPNDWTSQKAQQKYLETVINICNTLSPKYLALGIEVNTYYQYHSEDFDRFVAQYKKMYDAAKTTANCASTKIYVTFQLEKLKGLGAAVGYPGVSQWSVLDKFEGKLDVIAFTSYPEVQYATPAAIPSDYYSSILSSIPASLSGKKLGFTELGWNSQNLISVTGTNNSYQSQVDFISRFATITNSMKDAGQIEFAAWAFMHDYKTTGAFNPFRTIGLKNADGSQKNSTYSAWNAWQDYGGVVGTNLKLGIGPVPRNFPGSEAVDWLDMYNNVPAVGTLILAQSDWRDTLASAGQVPQLFLDIAAQKNAHHHADSLYGIGFFDLSNGTPQLN